MGDQLSKALPNDQNKFLSVYITFKDMYTQRKYFHIFIVHKIYIYIHIYLMLLYNLPLMFSSRVVSHVTKEHISDRILKLPFSH